MVWILHVLFQDRTHKYVSFSWHQKAHKCAHQGWEKNINMKGANGGKWQSVKMLFRKQSDCIFKSKSKSGLNPWSTSVWQTKVSCRVIKCLHGPLWLLGLQSQLHLQTVPGSSQVGAEVVLLEDKARVFAKVTADFDLGLDSHSAQEGKMIQHHFLENC